MSRLSILCAVVCAAGVAWLSQGTLAFTGSGAERIALLPVGAGTWLIVAAVMAATFAAARRASSVAPVALLALLVLPWLPASLPAALQIWRGPLALLVWCAVALVFLVPAIRTLPMPARPHLAAGVLAASIHAIAAWQVSPSIPGGDEPHYLIITQSLLRDGDLKIENNHRQGDHLSYYAGALPPDYRVRGRDREIYSIHAPGVSALVAPAFAVGGYPAVVVFLILLSAAGSVLAWHLGWRLTGSAAAAWFGWAAVTLSTTNIFHAFTVYPDGPGGVIALTGAWALLRAQDEQESGGGRVVPWLLHGVALAALPWMHSRFALLAGGFGALILLRLARTENAAAKASAFLAVPALSALAWIGYFVAIYGTPDPSAPYGNEPGSFAFVPGGLAGLFFDQRFGLLAYAPVLAFGIGGLGAMLARPRYRRLALEYLFVLVPYLIVVTHFAMWWGGRSAPARFMVPVLLLLAVPASVAWTAIRSRATRATAWGSLAFTAFASAALIFVDGGRLAYNTREAYAQWLEWLNPSADLGHGLPAFWRGREGELFRDAAIWIAALAAAWLLLRLLEGRSWWRGQARFGSITAGAYAVAAMAAFAAVWSFEPSDPPQRLAFSQLAIHDSRLFETSSAAAGQLAMLRRLGAEPRALTFQPWPPKRFAAGEVPRRMRMRPVPSTQPGGAGRSDRPLYSIPSIPAGDYRLHFEGGAGTWTMIGIGRDQFAIRTQQLGSPPEPIDLRFPVDVRAIVVRGDEQARRRVPELTIEPLSIVSPDARLSDRTAVRAVRYGAATAYFMDERSFPEPEAFWVGGSRESEVVLQPDEGRSSAQLLVRNGGAANDVAIHAGEWSESFRMAPGEERRIDVPLDTRRGATLIRFSSSSGFRPSAVDPASRDDRFLGVWVKVFQSISVSWPMGVKPPPGMSGGLKP